MGIDRVQARSPTSNLPHHQVADRYPYPRRAKFCLLTSCTKPSQWNSGAIAFPVRLPWLTANQGFCNLRRGQVRVCQAAVSTARSKM
ncbi:hypothetical protein [Coleofasciculus sp. H7-2]|uniref:hypothetical protein n=1 Tax=Coleofasciculus sp. H7-2 TaxID=3351545 RepID=UPI00366E9E01